MAQSRHLRLAPASLGAMEALARHVRPPSASREAAGVAVAVAAVVLLGALRIVTLPRATSSGSPATASAVLTAEDQVVYQALLVGVDAVTTVKKKSGAWPSAQALAADDVPPFAAGLLPAAARGLVWSVAAKGPTADYSGVDPSGKRTAFLLRVKEREKGASAEVWFRKGGSTSAAGAYPVREGWFELVALDGDTGARP